MHNSGLQRNSTCLKTITIEGIWFLDWSGQQAELLEWQIYVDG